MVSSGWNPHTSKWGCDINYRQNTFWFGFMNVTYQVATERIGIPMREFETRPVARFGSDSTRSDDECPRLSHRLEGVGSHSRRAEGIVFQDAGFRS